MHDIMSFIQDVLSSNFFHTFGSEVHVLHIVEVFTAAGGFAAASRCHSVSRSGCGHSTRIYSDLLGVSDLGVTRVRQNAALEMSSRERSVWNLLSVIVRCNVLLRRIIMDQLSFCSFFFKDLSQTSRTQNAHFPVRRCSKCQIIYRGPASKTDDCADFRIRRVPPRGTCRTLAAKEAHLCIQLRPGEELEFSEGHIRRT